MKIKNKKNKKIMYVKKKKDKRLIVCLSKKEKNSKVMGVVLLIFSYDILPTFQYKCLYLYFGLSQNKFPLS